MPFPFELKVVSEEYDYLSPDGAEIRLLSQASRGGICHCTQPVNKVSMAVYHKTVEEMWYFISGEGEVWQKQGEVEKIVSVQAGVSLILPPRTIFQYRNTGKEPLCFIDVTIPLWPGPDEAVPAIGIWTAVNE